MMPRRRTGPALVAAVSSRRPGTRRWGEHGAGCDGAVVGV